MRLFLLFRLLLIVHILHSPNFLHCNAAKILFSAAVDTGTHMGSMLPLIRRTASAGHEVTVFETSSLKAPRQLGPNVTVLFFHIPQDGQLSGRLARSMFDDDMRSHILYVPYAIGNEKFREFVHDEKIFGAIRRILHTDWDLVIVDELFGIHSFALARYLHHYRNVPYIIYSTTSMVHSTIHRLALGRSWVSEPYLLTKVPDDEHDTYSASRWSDRLHNIHSILGDLLVVDFLVERRFTNSVSLLGQPAFAWHDFFTQSSWVFADYATRMRYALTEGADVRSIGSHCDPAAPLPDELERFVDDSRSNGTVYIAFGSYVNWHAAPRHFADAFFAAVERLDGYRVIFSYNGPPRSVGAHVRLTRWAPQLSVLAHPRTRLFVSHGGLKSWKETLCQAVPSVYMPVFAEQSYNAKLALRMGYALAVNKLRVGEDARRQPLSDALEKVLSNHDAFKRNALRARSLFLDRPIDALDEAQWAIRRAVATTRSRRREDSVGGDRREAGAQRKKMYFQRAAIHFGTETLLHAELVLAVAVLVLYISWK